MATLGQKPATQHVSLQKQTITGNGGTSYTLQQSVGSALDIAVFVNNTRQEPSIAYSASGTTLTMTGAVNASDSFYVIFLGKAIATTGLPIDAVGTSNINANAVTMDKLATSGTLPALDGSALTGVGVAGIATSSSSGTAISIDSGNRVTLPVQPAFSMHKGGNASANAIIVLNAGFNQGNHVNTSTGVFTAPVDGRYFFNGYAIKANANGTVARLQIRKNSSAICEARMDESGNYTQAAVSIILDLVANDTVDFYAGGNTGFYMDGYYGRCSGHLIG